MDYLRYSHLGIVFITIFFGCFYLGNLLDHHYGLSPLGSLGGAFTGFAIGFYTMIKELDKKK